MPLHGETVAQDKSDHGDPCNRLKGGMVLEVDDGTSRGISKAGKRNRGRGGRGGTSKGFRLEGEERKDRERRRCRWR
jgi:hypothetical protein